MINRRALPIFDRLNGKKKLIMGNHDIFPIKDYLKHFYEVAAYRIMDDLVMSHIPIHEESLKQRWRANVHGHLHDGRVMRQIPSPFEGVVVDGIEKHPRYLCVSVEHTDFAPLPMDEVLRRIAEQQRRLD